MKRLPAPVAALGLLAAAALSAVGALGIATSASAVPVPDADGILSIHVDTLPLWHADLQPGDVRYWFIETELDSPEAGELSMELEAAGELSMHPQGLMMDIERCTVAWTVSTTPTCAGSEATLLAGPVSDIDQSEVWDLGAIEPHDGPFFLVTLRLPASMPSELQNTSGTIGFGFTAAESTAVVVIPGGGRGGGGLTETGVDLAAPLLLAGGLVVGGLVIARQRVAEPRVAEPRGTVSREAAIV